MGVKYNKPLVSGHEDRRRARTDSLGCGANPRQYNDGGLFRRPKRRLRRQSVRTFLRLGGAMSERFAIERLLPVFAARGISRIEANLARAGEQNAQDRSDVYFFDEAGQRVPFGIEDLIEDRTGRTLPIQEAWVEAVEAHIAREHPKFRALRWGGQAQVTVGVPEQRVAVRLSENRLVDAKEMPFKYPLTQEDLAQTPLNDARSVPLLDQALFALKELNAARPPDVPAIGAAVVHLPVGMPYSKPTFGLLAEDLTDVPIPDCVLNALHETPDRWVWDDVRACYAQTTARPSSGYEKRLASVLWMFALGADEHYRWDGVRARGCLDGPAERFWRFQVLPQPEFTGIEKSYALEVGRGFERMASGTSGSVERREEGGESLSP